MKKIITIIMIMVLHTYLWGAYLSNIPITITQPDGTIIECFATGDEYYNWAHDADGYTIIQDIITGYYCYAILVGDSLVASQYIVSTVLPASVNLTPHINISGEKIREKASNSILNTPTEEIFQESDASSRGFTGIVNNIVVYIRFFDQDPFPAEQATKYTPMFNSTSNGYNSMRNYFKEVSYNQLNVVSYFYPTNNGTVILSYQSWYNRDYFCPYNAVTNPSGYANSTERREREHGLLLNAINSIKDQVPTSLNLDSNNDGKVDNVCFIIRGNATAWNTLLWPHKWSLSTQFAYINEKRVYNYNFQLEERLSTNGNGTLSHEMNHTFGAPDLYHSNSDSTPVGSWDVMANNRNPPQHMGAHMKYRYGGWISSIPSITTSGTYTLHPLTSSTNNCYKIPIHGSSQYLVVEYRQKTGTFESSIWDSGLVIYRINETYTGNFFATGHGGVSDEVYVFRPNGTTTSNGDIYNAAFSELSEQTTFSNTTNPFCFVSNGSFGNIYIKNIRENNNGTLSFDVRFCDNNDIIYSNTINLPPLTNASNSIQTSGTVKVRSNEHVVFEAGNEVILNSGFEVQLGSLFEIFMNDCGE